MAECLLSKQDVAGSNPVSRSTIKQAISACFICKFIIIHYTRTQNNLGVYFAYSVTLLSLITLTFISPGYFNSSSILLAISLANFLA